MGLVKPLMAAGGIAAITLASFFLHIPAHAHGPAQWIADGGYKDLKAPFTRCCGDDDCVELSNDDVDVVRGGYRIIPLDEFVPMSDVQWTEPGHRLYWRCHYSDGRRRCFFAPPQGS